MRAFISCASEDAPRGEALAGALRAVGFEVVGGAWEAGGGWPLSLGDSIGRCHHFVLLCSAHAERSDVVAVERCIAVALGKSIIPVVLDGESLPLALSGLASLELGVVEAVAEAVTRRQPAPRRLLRVLMVNRALRGVRSSGGLALAEVRARLGRGAGRPAVDGALLGLGGWGLGALAALVVGGAAVVDVLLAEARMPASGGAPRLESIAGTVRDGAGVAVAGARVLAPRFGVEVLSSADGSFRLELVALRDEEVALRVFCDDGACQPFKGAAVVGEQDRTLTVNAR